MKNVTVNVGEKKKHNLPKFPLESLTYSGHSVDGGCYSVNTGRAEWALTWAAL